MNFLKSLIFASDEHDSQPIPTPVDCGQLYLLRPAGVKGLRECLFQDAQASLRSTGRRFLYEIVITRMFDEDEAMMQRSGSQQGSGDGAVAFNTRSSKHRPARQTSNDDCDELFEEQAFLLDPALQIRFGKHESCTSIVWRDMDGEPEDVFEFVCDASVSKSTVGKFQRCVLQCLYQRKYERTHENATIEELESLVYTAPCISTTSHPHVVTPPKVSATQKPTGRQSQSNQSNQSPKSPATPSQAKSTAAYEFDDLETPRPLKTYAVPQKESPRPAAPQLTKTSVTPVAKAESSKSTDPVLPPVRTMPSGQSLLAVSGPMFLYDTATQSFVPSLPEVDVEILKASDCDYWLGLWHNDQAIMGQPIDDNMNMYFAEDKHVAIWNYYDEQKKPISVALMLSTDTQWQDFKRLYSECVVEVSIGEALSSLKLNNSDKNYLAQCAYSNEETEMRDANSQQSYTQDDDEEEERDYSDEEEEQEISPIESIEESADESEEEEGYGYKAPKHADTQNSQLAVSYMHDRSFVVRGNKIGVFAHTDDDGIRFDTTINNVRDRSGRSFAPTQTMLHEQDSKMVLMHPDKPHEVLEMDLATGKVVNEWTVHDIVPVNQVVHNNKYAQMSTDKTFIGLSGNAIFRIDPRLSDNNKLCENEWQTLQTRTQFTAAATGGQGELIVGNEKGELRLYNKIGIRAKTQLPGLGDAIVGVDVTVDGKWVVATTRTYLLLIDTTLASAGSDVTGFVKPMGEHKPVPIRLSLKPETVAAMGAPLQFTTAHFNTGEQGEQTIVSSSGPYVVTWNFKLILQQQKRNKQQGELTSGRIGGVYDYHIKRYPDTVVADQFKYGTSKAIVVALPHDVTMVKTRALQTSSRNSLSGITSNESSELRTTTRNLRSRSSIVNSPY